MRFLRKKDLLLFHSRSIDRFGGARGVMNDGALDSALIAAENRFHYEQADVAACAAAYAYHLTMAHAFLDGNKRVAAVATEVFVALNGMELGASDDELYELFMGIASGSRRREDVALALRGWLRPARDSA